MFRKLGLAILVSLALSLLAVSAVAQSSLPGEVVDVIDGRTLLVAVPAGTIKIELQYIEVPDPGQQLYNAVKYHLRDLVAGKTVTYRPRTILRDRTIGRLMLNNVDVSQQMLRDGAAWHIPSEASGQEKGEFDLYASTEAEAKQEKRGVWSIPGLKRASEIAEDERADAEREEQVQSALNRSARANGRSGRWADINPALGNVGALVNGYNAETKTGFLSTSLLALEEMDKTRVSLNKGAFEFTYYYKEDDRKGRKGFFVATVASVSKKPLFAGNNNLVLIADGRMSVVSKPRRTVSNEGDNVRETLTYQLSRSTMDKIVNGSDVFLKIGSYIIESQGVKFLLYNMLQLSQ